MMSFISFIFTTGGRCRHASGLRSVYSRPNGFLIEFVKQQLAIFNV